MNYIGLMSGTSADGIDAALVSLDPLAGAKPQLLHYLEVPYPDPLASALRAARARAAQANRFAIDAEYRRLHTELGNAFADAALALLAASGCQHTEIRAIGAHGQTLFHTPPVSVQAGDAQLIAARTGITTVADFRQADLALGGQGAPLAPAIHQLLFRDPQHSRAVVNIGGIANVTFLPADPALPVTGFDTGPGNCLMDDWIFQQHGKSYDSNGGFAASGKVAADLLSRCLSDPYFAVPPPKSSGRELFHLTWLQQQLAGLTVDAADVQATLALLSVRSIAQSLTFAPASGSGGTAISAVLICGGGAYNTQLMALLAHELAPATVSSTAQYGLNPAAVEAVLMAWLAHQRLENQPGNIVSVTGASRAAVLGVIHSPSLIPNG